MSPSTFSNALHEVMLSEILEFELDPSGIEELEFPELSEFGS